MSSLYSLAKLPFLPLILLFLQANGAKIFFTGIQMNSHVMEQLALAEELASRGHQVYVGLGSRYPNKDKVVKRGISLLTYRIPDNIPYYCGEEILQIMEHMAFNTSEEEKIKIQTQDITQTVATHCQFMMTDKDFIESVRKVQFDIAVVEPFVLGPCSLMLPKYMGIPFVSLTPLLFPWTIRVPTLPSAYVQAGPWPLANLGTLKGRMDNFIIYLLLQFEFIVKIDLGLLKEYAGELSTWDELIRESVLFIIENDNTLEDSYPVMPNVIRVSGFTSKPSNPLPTDLQEIANQSSSGIIVMTFGSLIRRIPEDITIKLLEAFSKLNQTVLAKLTAPAGYKVSANVKLFDWIPQNDILGHPNSRLFITHCGSNGQHESVYHGVPMLGFPLFAEQLSNCQRASKRGYGLCMNIKDFSSEELFDKIQELLNNKEYGERVKKASAIFRWESMTGRETAAFWIEHVIKFGGSHLRSAAMDMPLYQFLMLDILAVLLVGVTLFIVLVIALQKCIWKALIYIRKAQKEKIN